MNKLATALLAIVGVIAVALGVQLLVVWLSPPIESGMSLGPVFGSVVVAAGIGAGVTARAVWKDRSWGWLVAFVAGGLLVLFAYLAWSTPGPPPLPLPITAAMAVIGITLASLSIARLVRGRTP